jgi:hypothetical protein
MTKTWRLIVTEYAPPYGKRGAYFTVKTPYQQQSSFAPEFYLLDDDSGEISSKFFGRLGNPTYNMGPETYHDSGYNTYTVNHGFTIPTSSKFRFQEPKTAKFNELACPIDNQRRVHGYLLCYGVDPSVHTHQFVGGQVLLRQGDVVFSLPWGFGTLSVERVTRVEFADKNMIGERQYTWDSDQQESSGEDYILLQDPGANNLFPSKWDASIYVFEVSDRISQPGTFSSAEPTHSSTTLSTRWNSLAEHQVAIQRNIEPLHSDEDVINDLNEALFFTVHPAAASEMSDGEKTDMYHLANGYFGKGIFHHKPGLKLLPHQFVGDYNINSIRDSIQRHGTPQEYEVYIVNQDDYLRYSQRVSCSIQTNGFEWVENLLSSATTSIHESQYTDSANPPNMTLDISVDTLIGEHFWWDTTGNSYAGAVSDDPFFRVTGSTVRDGTAEKNLEKAYPSLIAYAKSYRRSPLTIQILHNTQKYSNHEKWKRNLRDFCIRTGYFPETLYIRFDNLALNPKTMTTIGENVIDDGGGDQPQLLVAPGFDPNDIPNADETNHIKYSMLEIDIIPMNPDIFPTSLPIMWSNQAFQFFYDKASGDEATAINRFQGSFLDYGYEVMTVGQDFYYDDGTNMASTNYPITLTGEEYSKCYRENISRLVSTYSEWEFPSHLSELPTTASDRDSTVAFGFREPAGHRIIVTNINCVTPSSP